jgi:phage replication O-like protein O
MTNEVNPQKENGYTAIANEIMEALARIRISGEARQVLDVILQKTYGFNKKEDVIALSQFCAKTGLKKPIVCRAINKLEEMKLIIKKDNDIANSYSLQKDYSKWEPLSKKITLSKKIISVIKKDNPSLSLLRHTIATTTKTTITKTIPPTPQRVKKWFEDENLNKEFEEYIAMRKKIGKITDHAIELNKTDLIKLGKNSPEQMIAICQQSIMHSWKGFYPLKKQIEESTPTNPDATLTVNGTFKKYTIQELREAIKTGEVKKGINGELIYNKS